MASKIIEKAAWSLYCMGDRIARCRRWLSVKKNRDDVIATVALVAAIPLSGL